MATAETNITALTELKTTEQRRLSRRNSVNLLNSKLDQEGVLIPVLSSSSRTYVQQNLLFLIRLFHFGLESFASAKRISACKALSWCLYATVQPVQDHCAVAVNNC